MGQFSGKLYTIPPGTAFIDALVKAVLAGDLPKAGGRPPSPIELAGFTIYLPTRRACRAARAAFLAATGRSPADPVRATLLPRIQTLGEVGDNARLLAAGDIFEIGAAAPPAIDPLERIMVLTRFILSWMERLKHGGVWETAPSDLFARSTPATAADLAFELARLADQAQIEGRSLAALGSLAPERFADHWRLTLDFLKIVAEQWPGYLASAKAVDPMQRRNLMLAHEAHRLKSATDSRTRGWGDVASLERRRNATRPLIIAGAVGAAPATIDLMNAVLADPDGALALPGLDLGLDEAIWRTLADHPEHPQHALKLVLDRLGAERADVAVLPGAEPSPTAAARLTFFREALLPADATLQWRRRIDGADRNAVKQALAGVSLVETPSAQAEAQTIALILRETAETPGKTAALVTPDRTLARRVAALLDRWGIVIDDSGGSPLVNAPQGAFLDLVAEAACEGSPTAFLSLLKHPLTRLGLPRSELRARVAVLELLAIRQPWRDTGLEGLRRRFDQTEEALALGVVRHPALTRLTPLQRRDASQLIDRLDEAFRPWTNLRQGALPGGALWAGRGSRAETPAPFAALAAAHRAAAEALAQDETGDAAALWSKDAGEAFDSLFQRFADEALPAPSIIFTDYPSFYRSLIRREVTRSSQPAHPRLAIWGPLEARLLRPDLAVLGGLNEGIWPEAADPGPWLNRPMRTELGLEPPERRTGLAAHDFTQLMGAPEVVLTRSLKTDGAPTTPSRWLARMNVLLDGLNSSSSSEAIGQANLRGESAVLAPPRPWLSWALANHAATTTNPPSLPPAPRPPVSARPRTLPVTAIETWLANPYAIFARHILGLEPLPAPGAGLGASEQGQIIHEALAQFCRRHPVFLPADPAAELIKIASVLMARLGDNPRLRAFWRPRIERFALWFGRTEPARRENVVKAWGEAHGALALNAPAGPFTLTARADRIDLLTDGSLAIYDYKTGMVPKEAAVVDFRSPQLPLEALIALEQGFRAVDYRRAANPAAISKLAFIAAAGGEPPGEEFPITRQSPAELAQSAREGLAKLVELFDQPTTPYRALRRPAFGGHYRFDAYAQLARAVEWMNATLADSDGGRDNGDRLSK